MRVFTFLCRRCATGRRKEHSHNGVGVQEAEAARNVEGHPLPLLRPAADAAALPLQRSPEVPPLHILHHQHRAAAAHARPLRQPILLSSLRAHALTTLYPNHAVDHFDLMLI